MVALVYVKSFTLFRKKVHRKLTCRVLLRNEQFVLGPASLVLGRDHRVDKSDQRVLTGS